MKMKLIYKCLYYLMKFLREQEYKQFGPDRDWKEINDCLERVRSEHEASN